MQASDAIVFLLDCDNTLLDNDRVQDDLRLLLERDFGKAGCDRYWQIFEDLRARLGYADYLQALQHLRMRLGTLPPVAMITADGSSELKQRARELGYPLLHKPVRPAALRALLGALLRKQASSG